MVIEVMKLKDACSWKKNYDKPRQCIKKLRDHFANKRLYSQSYGFSSSYLWCENWTIKKADHHQELMLLNCGVGEDS